MNAPVKACLPLLPCVTSPKVANVQTGIYPNTADLFQQVFHQRKEICLVLIKLSKICNDTNRRRSFEAAYDKDKISCEQGQLL